MVVGDQAWDCRIKFAALRHLRGNFQTSTKVSCLPFLEIWSSRGKSARRADKQGNKQTRTAESRCMAAGVLGKQIEVSRVSCRK